MITRLSRSTGVSILELKVGNALRKICSSTQTAYCMQGERSYNPKVYKADYFGYKLRAVQMRMRNS